MKDISYEILDLFRQYGSGPEGIRKALDNQSRPEVLHALSDIRENLLEWLDYTGCGEVLQIGSGYGVLTGLLASRCAHVTVMDEADENLAVNQERNKAYSNITYGFKTGTQAGQPEPSFDLVVIGGLREGQEIRDAVTFGASFLKQEGRLVIACENALGLRYLAGGNHEEGFCTRKQAEEACQGAGLGRISIIRCPTTECPYHFTQTGICREREKSPARLCPMKVRGMPASMKGKCMTV